MAMAAAQTQGPTVGQAVPLLQTAAIMQTMSMSKSTALLRECYSKYVIFLDDYYKLLSHINAETVTVSQYLVNLDIVDPYIKKFAEIHNNYMNTFRQEAQVATGVALQIIDAMNKGIASLLDMERKRKEMFSFLSATGSNSLEVHRLIVNDESYKGLVNGVLVSERSYYALKTKLVTILNALSSTLAGLELIRQELLLYKPRGSNVNSIASRMRTLIGQKAINIKKLTAKASAIELLIVNDMHLKIAEAWGHIHAQNAIDPNFSVRFMIGDGTMTTMINQAKQLRRALDVEIDGVRKELGYLATRGQHEAKTLIALHPNVMSVFKDLTTMDKLIQLGNVTISVDARGIGECIRLAESGNGDAAALTSCLRKTDAVSAHNAEALRGFREMVEMKAHKYHNYALYGPLLQALNAEYLLANQYLNARQAEKAAMKNELVAQELDKVKSGLSDHADALRRNTLQDLGTMEAHLAHQRSMLSATKDQAVPTGSLGWQMGELNKLKDYIKRHRSYSSNYSPTYAPRIISAQQGIGEVFKAHLAGVIHQQRHNGVDNATALAEGLAGLHSFMDKATTVSKSGDRGFTAVLGGSQSAIGQVAQAIPDRERRQDLLASLSAAISGGATEQQVQDMVSNIVATAQQNVDAVSGGGMSAMFWNVPVSVLQREGLLEIDVAYQQFEKLAMNIKAYVQQLPDEKQRGAALVAALGALDKTIKEYTERIKRHKSNEYAGYSQLLQKRLDEIKNRPSQMPEMLRGAVYKMLPFYENWLKVIEGRPPAKHKGSFSAWLTSNAGQVAAQVADIAGVAANPILTQAATLMIAKHVYYGVTVGVSEPMLSDVRQRILVLTASLLLEKSTPVAAAVVLDQNDPLKAKVQYEAAKNQLLIQQHLAGNAKYVELLELISKETALSLFV